RSRLRHDRRGRPRIRRDPPRLRERGPAATPPGRHDRRPRGPRRERRGAPPCPRRHVRRRGALGRLDAGLAGISAGDAQGPRAAGRGRRPGATGGFEGVTSSLSLTVNDRPRTVSIEPHHTLLEVLRADLGLTGTKECCLVGECGACTVILDGRSVDSCLVLALEAEGAEIVTVEGLARDGELDPLQTAFLDHGAAQCGFCIPGQLVSARALLATTPHPTRAEVEDGLAGNLCRCAGYEQIIEAVLAAAAGGRKAGPVASPAVGDRSAVPDANVAPQ